MPISVSVHPLSGWLLPKFGKDAARPPISVSVPREERDFLVFHHSAWSAHLVEPKYANNLVECDHGRLKARLRPMRGLKTDRTASVVIRGHAFVQNLRRCHYELGTDSPHPHLRLVAAFEELTETI